MVLRSIYFLFLFTFYMGGKTYGKVFHSAPKSLLYHNILTHRYLNKCETVFAFLESIAAGFGFTFSSFALGWPENVDGEVSG